MLRHAAVFKTPQSHLDLTLPDDESLWNQLCEHLYLSGFLFDDAARTEVQQGEDVLCDFFEQESELFTKWLQRDRLQRFIAYFQELNLPRETLKKKLRQRILKFFDQLTRGQHHHFNFRRNIHLGLISEQAHPFHDFLLCLEAYYRMFLDQGEKVEVSQRYSIQEILNLRQEIREGLEKHKLVELLLNDIRRKGRVHIPENTERSSAKHVTIQFVRPSQRSQLKPSSLSAKATQNHTTSNDGGPVSSQERPQTSPQKQETAPVEQKSEEPDYEEFLEENNQRDNDALDEDVVYGTAKITWDSMAQFVMDYPDSALKFIFRKNLDEKVLEKGIGKVYDSWEKRGMKRIHVQKCILELMEWKEFPKKSMANLWDEIKDKIYDIRHGE
ncbi:hypothetical protein WDW89_00130 [Deltaproteobacteria bacterium TL4]